MEQPVSKIPMIALVITATTALLAFSIAQHNAKKAWQETAVKALQTDHDATAAVMRKIGEDAQALENAKNDEVHKALQALDAQDEAEWHRRHPKAQPPR